MRSAGGILHLGGSENFVAEVGAEFVGGAQVHFPAAEERGEFPLHGGHSQEARAHAGLEFDEHVNIAGIGEPFGEHGAEEQEAADAVAAAEFGQLLPFDIDVSGNHAYFDYGSGCAGAGREKARSGVLRAFGLGFGLSYAVRPASPAASSLARAAWAAARRAMGTR